MAEIVCSKPTPLTAAESARLAELETTVERGLKTFVEVGVALAEINGKRLYRATHTTFEQYCKEHWGVTRRRAYQLIKGAEVTTNVNLGSQSLTPRSEREVRPLVSLPPDEQRAAWKESVETAPDGKVTSQHVANVVNLRKRSAANPTRTTTKQDDDEDAVYMSLEEIRHRVNQVRELCDGIDLSEHLRDTLVDVAYDTHKVLTEIIGRDPRRTS